MRKSKDFISLPVISLQEGQQIGTVKGLVVDPALKQVVALIIEQKGWFKEQRYIPYHKVKSVGDDAITIDRSTSVERGSGQPNIIKLLKDGIAIKGTRMVTGSGTLLGYVDEYYVDLTSGQLVGLEFTNKRLQEFLNGKAFLDIAYVETIGKDAIICTDEAVDNVVKLEGGLQETIQTIRESTSRLWTNTREKTRTLGNSVSRSLGKITKRGQNEDDTPGSN